jgi:hypothetical protein
LRSFVPVLGARLARRDADHAPVNAGVQENTPRIG